jgi:hypothetical protein
MGNICKNLKRFTADINIKDACKSSCCNSKIDKHIDIVINKNMCLDDDSRTPPTSPDRKNDGNASTNPVLELTDIINEPIKLN